MSSPRRRLRPVTAAVAGCAIVGLLAVVLGPLSDHRTGATPALVLVVPIVVTALVGGRRAAYAVCVATTLAFSLIIPPVGSIRVGVREDLLALAVFLIVAVSVGTLVAGRIELLHDVDRQRVGLLRSVSHDLRTPLAAIKAASLDLRGDEVSDPAVRAELLDIVIDEADRLDRLVANLLSLGRIEAGFLRPQRQAVDVRELVDVSARRLERLWGEHRLEVDVPVGLPLIDADHALVEQVVVNLLENAVRHSPPGAPVRLEARAVGGGVALAVVDAGRGVDALVRGHLFEPFSSGALAGSSGIGLAICKAVVEAHGGTIAFSDAAGRGARFTATFPRA